MGAQPNSLDTPAASTGVLETFNTLQHCFASGVTKDRAWRDDQLAALAQMIESNQALLLDALAADLGKCATEAYTSEIGFTLSDIRHTRKHLKAWMKPRKVATPIVAQPGSSFRLPEPLGVVLIIGAWNYPVQLVLAPLVAAIAAGNCAIIKPSELASETSKALANLIPRYLDKQAFAVVEGAKDETTELLKLPFDHFFYTGGEMVGKIVMRAAAEHLASVTLELGGKSPCIVTPSAAYPVTADRIVWGKWMNAGQTCVAPDYILVQRGHEQALIEALKAALSRQYGENPQQSKDYGRIINQRHHQRLASYLEGVDVIYGGEHDVESRFFAPTLVLNPPEDSAIMNEEIFGPILPIVVLDDIDDAPAYIRRRPKPLALYLFSGDADQQQRMLTGTSAGNVCINDTMMFMANPDLPFGGVGTSGMGNYHGRAGFDTLSHLKSVMRRPFILDAPVRYAPFNRLKARLLKWLI